MNIDSIYSLNLYKISFLACPGLMMVRFFIILILTPNYLHYLEDS